MGKHRVQHKEKRNANTKIQREIVHENRQLRREISRLRKQLDKTVTPSYENEEVKEEIQSTIKCLNCQNTDIASITTPLGKTINICRLCGWRGTI